MDEGPSTIEGLGGCIVRPSSVRSISSTKFYGMSTGSGGCNSSLAIEVDDVKDANPMRCVDRIERY